MRKRLAAEAIGTFALVLVGTGAIVLNDVTGGDVTHIGISLAFGLIVTAMIFAFGGVSGAHINPAVTIGLWRAGRFQRGEVAPYIASQCLGAILASGLLRVLYPMHETLGATEPAGSLAQSFALELCLTLVLMSVILHFATNPLSSRISAGLAIGAVVGLEAYFAGPTTGASMNPARSLGPALVSFRFEVLWIYVVATVLGALAAVPLCRLWSSRAGCCASVDAVKRESS
ncbi:MAG: aquaporin NIP [Planctomycetota bacterium]|jgi:aquaporin NIP